MTQIVVNGEWVHVEGRHPPTPVKQDDRKQPKVQETYQREKTAKECFTVPGGSRPDGRAARAGDRSRTTVVATTEEDA